MVGDWPDICARKTFVSNDFEGGEPSISPIVRTEKRPISIKIPSQGSAAYVGEKMIFMVSILRTTTLSIQAFPW